MSVSADFVKFAVEQGALRFGEFTLKSGRISPYFFNAGQFNSGAAIARLGWFYAEAIKASGVGFDMLFGPAYKGIPLATATAIALAQQGRDAPCAFNRKEIKDHGEGGSLMGAPLAGRVLIVDDVITAGGRTVGADYSRSGRYPGGRRDRLGSEGTRSRRVIGNSGGGKPLWAQSNRDRYACQSAELRQGSARYGCDAKRDRELSRAVRIVRRTMHSSDAPCHSHLQLNHAQL